MVMVVFRSGWGWDGAWLHACSPASINATAVVAASVRREWVLRFVISVAHFGQISDQPSPLEPRQGRPQRIKARRVGISVAFDDAPDCRSQRGQLVGREVNRRHLAG
jgi:hypothetical protein